MRLMRGVRACCPGLPNVSGQRGCVEVFMYLSAWSMTVMNASGMSRCHVLPVPARSMPTPVVGICAGVWSRAVTRVVLITTGDELHRAGKRQVQQHTPQSMSLRLIAQASEYASPEARV